MAAVTLGASRVRLSQSASVQTKESEERTPGLPPALERNSWVEEGEAARKDDGLMGAGVAVGLLTAGSRQAQGASPVLVRSALAEAEAEQPLVHLPREAEPCEP